LARKQAQQQQQQQLQQRASVDAATVSRNELSTIEEQRKRKTSQGDHNNNSDSDTNPFRKLLRRLGFGNSSSATQQNQRHVSFQDSMISADCESGIEQAVSASESTSVAVTAWH